MNIAFKAMELARKAHASQRRKYTNAPYTDHLAEVAGIVATITDFDTIHPEALIATAWLHDIVEDCGYTAEHLWAELDPKSENITEIEQIVRGVLWLSDMEEGNRSTRKQLSRERLASAPHWVQTIKCADLISNTGSIVQLDPAFAKVYLEEKRLLLDVMTKADRRLWNIANQLSQVTA